MFAFLSHEQARIGYELTSHSGVDQTLGSVKMALEGHNIVRLVEVILAVFEKRFYSFDLPLVNEPQLPQLIYRGVLRQASEGA